MSASGMGNLIFGIILILTWLYFDALSIFGVLRFVGDLCLLLGLLFISNHYTQGKVMSVIFK